jgi:phenylalanyl-tRNA synthetase beta chain
MKIPLRWLRDYIDLDVDVESLCNKLTMLGLEIESVEQPGETIQGVVVGRIVSAEPHPDADRLQICRTDVGGPEPLQIVCGATNFKVGDRVPTAVVGASLPGGFAIGRRKMRGVESQGMMCSARELGLGEEHAGLLILDDSTEVGADIKPLLGLDDVILEIEVTPNRGDWAGLIGIARELAAAYGKPLRLPEPNPPEAGKPVTERSSVQIDAPDLCPRYAGRIIEGVTVGPSPDWLRNRLIAAGQRPINNIVDVTNYVLLETGHPLHAFDLDRLDEQRIIVRQAQPGERIRTLDEIERSLPPDMLVIADAKVPVAVAGVMGGHESEVGESTQSVFLESAYFQTASVRRTAKQLNLATEASQRFQRGADPDIVLYALNRAAELIIQVAGGKAAPGILDAYPDPLKKQKITLNFTSTEQYLGTNVPIETQIALLESLGFTVDGSDANGASFTVPLRRYDVSQEADLIEDIARLYGYDAIPANLPRIRPMSDVVPAEYGAIRRIRETLLAAGLTETVHWTFMQAEDRPWEWQKIDWVPLANPLSERHAGMRTSLLPGLVATTAANLRKGVSGVAIMEIGPVYGREHGEITQRTHLAIALAGRIQEQHFTAPLRDYDLHDLVGYLNLLIPPQTEFAYTASCVHPYLREGHTAAIELTGTGECGLLGTIDTAMLAKLDIEHHAVHVLELDLTPILETRPQAAAFRDIPRFPASHRDLAVVAERTIPASALSNTIRKHGGDHLRSIDLFDVYQGKGIPDAHRSLAFALTFQHLERTLTDKDIDKAVRRILQALEKEHGARLR